MYDKLIGALVGLARATEGNADRITPETDQALLDGLTASDEADLEGLLTRVAEEKRKLIPGCYTCAAPCGRNNDYDMAELQKEDPPIGALKMRLLDWAREIARVGTREPQTVAFLYKALIMLGITGYRESHLLPVLQEAEQYLEK